MKQQYKPGWFCKSIFHILLWGVLLLHLLAIERVPAQTAMVSVVPDADCFVRSLAAASNYGEGGGLSVSGSTAVNGSGIQNGLFDTLMRFSMSNAVSSLDSALGEKDWIITGAELFLTEMAAPDNAIFNRGVGAFEVRWIASDEWVEGTGKPNMPTSDGLTWQDLQTLVNSNLDVSLGLFTNSGSNGRISFGLTLQERFVADIRQGGEVGLYLTARSDEVGFTFNSRNFGNTNAQPLLMITAATNPHPQIDAIELAGTNVLVSFGTVSNWTYRLQGANMLPQPGSAPWSWSDLFISPSQPYATNLQFVDGLTNGGRFYRLAVSP